MELGEEIRVVHCNHFGQPKNVANAIVSGKGEGWIFVHLSREVKSFGVPPQFSLIELHYFIGRTVWVGQFLNSDGKAYRAYYNINEPLTATAKDVIFVDLELDILKNQHGFELLDVEDFRRAALTQDQLGIVKNSMFQIVSGKVDGWCSSTPFPLKPYDA